MIGLKMTDAQAELGNRIESFVLEKVVPYEMDARLTSHGPTDQLEIELSGSARIADLLAPQFSLRLGGMGRDHVSTSIAFEAAALSPLGPVALHCAAPDEGNINLLEKIGTDAQKDRWL